MIGSAGGCPLPFPSTPVAAGLRCRSSHLEQRSEGIKWEKSETGRGFSCKEEEDGFVYGRVEKV